MRLIASDCPKYSTATIVLDGTRIIDGTVAVDGTRVIDGGRVIDSAVVIYGASDTDADGAGVVDGTTNDC